MSTHQILREFSEGESAMGDDPLFDFLETNFGKNFDHTAGIDSAQRCALACPILALCAFSNGLHWRSRVVVPPAVLA